MAAVIGKAVYQLPHDAVWDPAQLFVKGDPAAPGNASYLTGTELFQASEGVLFDSAVGIFQLGSAVGAGSSGFTVDREILTAGKYLGLKNGTSKFYCYADRFTFQGTNTAVGYTPFQIQKIAVAETQFNFNVTRSWSVNPVGEGNEVVNIGWNVTPTATPELAGSGAMFWSMESGYRPGGTRIWEWHQEFINDAGTNRRISSYTINHSGIANPDIDFYHTVSRIYFKSPVTGNVQYQIGNFDNSASVGITSSTNTWAYQINQNPSGIDWVDGGGTGAGRNWQVSGFGTGNLGGQIGWVAAAQSYVITGGAFGGTLPFNLRDQSGHNAYLFNGDANGVVVLSNQPAGTFTTYFETRSSLTTGYSGFLGTTTASTLYCVQLGTAVAPTFANVPDGGLIQSTGAGGITIYAISSTLRLAAGGATRQTVLASGQIQFNSYGAGTYVGVATKYLAVTAAGLMIEVSGAAAAGLDDVLAVGQALTTNRTTPTSAFQWTIITSAATRGLYVQNTGAGAGYGIGAYSLSGSAGEFVNDGGGACLLVNAQQTGVGVAVVTNGNNAWQSTSTFASTNAVERCMFISRFVAGAAANGIGASIDIFLEASDGIGYLAGSFLARWTDVTVGARDSDVGIKTTLNGTDREVFTAKGSGQIAFDYYGSNLFTGTATKRLSVDASGNIIETALFPGIDDVLSVGQVLTANRTIAGSTFVLTVSGTSASEQLQVTNTSAGGNAIGASSVGGSAVLGSSSSGAGGFFLSSSGAGMQAQSTSSIAGYLLINPASTNSIDVILRLQRTSSGSVANGVGGSIEFVLEESTSTLLSNTISSKWSDSTHATRSATFAVRGVTSAVDADWLVIKPGGLVNVAQGMSTYASNALALVGGLVAGDLYMNSVGAVSIVF